jgi:hypothetical protein
LIVTIKAVESARLCFKTLFSDAFMPLKRLVSVR